MQLFDEILRIGDFNVTLKVTNDVKVINKDGSSEYERGSPNRWMRARSGYADLEISRYLVLRLSRLNDDGKREYERAAFSVFDLHKLRAALEHIQVLIEDTDDLFIENVDVDAGITKLVVNPKLKDITTVRISGYSGCEVAFRVTTAFNRLDNCYTGCVKVIINNKDFVTYIDFDRFLGIIDTIKHLDLIQTSHTLLTTYMTAAAVNKNLSKQIIKEE